MPVVKTTRTGLSNNCACTFCSHTHQAEADKRKADLQAIQDERKRLEEREKFIRSFSEQLNGKQSTKEQLDTIIGNAESAQGSDSNSKAFDWLKKAIEGYKPAAAKSF